MGTWSGSEALGKLIASYPEHFGRSILTTNFDPLLEVSIRRAGGSYFRTMLHSDGNLAQTEGIGCHVVHLHGYWYGSDTLHTPRQLTHPRPRLRGSLSALLRNKLVVACAYGGWDDVFTSTLVEVVNDDSAYPEVIWTFYPETPPIDATLSKRLAPGIDRGRITLYHGISCNFFFPELLKAWSNAQVRQGIGSRGVSNPVRVPDAVAQQVIAQPHRQVIIEGDDEDRPPVVEICVGRNREMVAMRNSEAKVIFLSGLGGQGKSTLAAAYYAECQGNPLQFSFLVWRDCKEEKEHFESQLVAVIERFSEGRLKWQGLGAAEHGIRSQYLAGTD